MKSTRFVTMLLAIVMCLSFCSGAFAETIKIGGIAPLTGEYAVYGTAVQQGADLYVDLINAQLKNEGSDKQFKIVWLDNQADDTEAQNAYYKLVDQEKVVAILGDVLSGNTEAVARCAADDEMPMVSASATRYEITTDRPCVFRTCFLDPFQGVVMANYAKTLGLAKVAIIYGNDSDYSIGVAESFEAQCKENGIEIVAKEGASFTDTDFSAQLTKIAAASPEALFVPFYGSEASQILPQAVSAGLNNVKFLGVDGTSDIVAFISDTSLLTNMVYPDHFAFDAESETIKNFISAYKDKYGVEPTISFAATGYEAALVLCNSILEAGTKKADITEAIKNSSYDALSGVITFDDHNDPIKSAFIMTFDAEGGKHFLVQQAPL